MTGDGPARPASSPHPRHAAHPEVARWLLTLAAALATGVAFVIVFAVIPPVRNIWVPNATGAGGAVPAFWVSVAGNLTCAAVLAAGGARRWLRRTPYRWMLALLVAGAAAQALAYLDAAAAFHGPPAAALYATRLWLLAAAAADGVGGVLVAASLIATRRPRPASAGNE